MPTLLPSMLGASIQRRSAASRALAFLALGLVVLLPAVLVQATSPRRRRRTRTGSAAKD